MERLARDGVETQPVEKFPEDQIVTFRKLFGDVINWKSLLVHKPRKWSISGGKDVVTVDKPLLIVCSLIIVPRRIGSIFRRCTQIRVERALAGKRTEATLRIY